MQGLMMDTPLTLQHAFDRAVRIFHRKEIVTRTDTGLHRYTYREWGKRTAQLAHALEDAGVKQGDRIATFGWNTYRHLELYFAVPCLGAVLHTDRQAARNPPGSTGSAGRAADTFASCPAAGRRRWIIQEVPGG